MRIIFLDIDGVLNNLESLRYPRIRLKASRHSYSAAHPSCVLALNRITDATNARIVISSTWRGFGLKILFEIFRQWGITGKVIGRTPDLGFEHERGDEIAKWLSTHSTGDESFVILDDGNDMGHLKHRLVQTDYEIGLTEADAARAIAILNAPPTDLLVDRMFAECGIK